MLHNMERGRYVGKSQALFLLSDEIFQGFESK